MSGIFPPSGVPAVDAYNSLPNPDVAEGCVPSWYSTSKCAPRFDPSALNAITAEIINLVNCSGLPYDCNQLDNLCEAVKKISQDAFVGCLTTPMPDASDACRLEYVVLATDLNGCKHFVRFTPDNFQVAFVTEASVYPEGTAETAIPVAADTPSTFYNRHELYDAQAAGNVNEIRLNTTKIFEINITVPCDDTIIDLEAYLSVYFKPDHNWPYGVAAQLVPRFNNIFDVNNIEGTVNGFVAFTNFEQVNRSVYRKVLNAGLHNIKCYAINVRDNGPTAQLRVRHLGLLFSNSMVIKVAVV